MRDGPPPSRSRAPAADRPRWCLASGPHRCGSLSPLPARPMLRSFRSRPPAAGPYAHPWDAPGPRAFHAHRGTSAAAGIGGNARPAFPSTVLETAPAIDRWSRPLSGPSATWLGWSSRSLSTHASPIGPSPGSGAREQVGQTPAAPEPILIDRFESQGIQKVLDSLGSAIAPWFPSLAAADGRRTTDRRSGRKS